MSASSLLIRSRLGERTRHRLSVASRVMAAAVGGYLLTSALAVLLALLLPVARSQAVVLGTDLGFLLAIPILLWAFHTRSALRAWGWLLAWTGMVALLSWYLIRGGAA
ncbi:hypothetical protein [Ottowia thiooxydans]|uniref:hypothetical protein n=1 Tax=Ottowia thiooxydans TaxID=219182 RepID=UPI00040A6134|nr:hypothetical protein [Ottowia thiooxydans]